MLTPYRSKYISSILAADPSDKPHWRDWWKAIPVFLFPSPEGCSDCTVSPLSFHWQKQPGCHNSQKSALNRRELHFLCCCHWSLQYHSWRSHPKWLYHGKAAAASSLLWFQAFFRSSGKRLLSRSDSGDDHSKNGFLWILPRGMSQESVFLNVCHTLVQIHAPAYFFFPYFSFNRHRFFP